MSRPAAFADLGLGDGEIVVGDFGGGNTIRYHQEVQASCSCTQEKNATHEGAEAFMLDGRCHFVIAYRDGTRHPFAGKHLYVTDNSRIG